MKLFFMRHGQTDYNLKALCNNNPEINVCLTNLGKKQCKEALNFLANEKIDVIFVSELPRTHESAKIVNERYGAEIKIDPRINDRNTGFEGRSVQEFLDAIRNDRINAKFNGGESFLDEKQRVISFLEDLKRREYMAVLVVAHHEPLKIVKGYFEGLSDEESINSRIENGQILSYEF